MKILICYLRTIKEFGKFLDILWDYGAIYIAHDYSEMTSYIKSDKRYYPIKCRTCGHISEAWEAE